MVFYLKNNIDGNVITFDNNLDSRFFQKGNTWNDYLSGKWIKLSELQSDFYLKNPNATPFEIFNAKKNETSEEELISIAKNEKIQEIKEYDSSPMINIFYVNGAPNWLDKSTRNGIFNRLMVEKEAGKTDTTIWLNESRLIISVEDAYSMLKSIEEYAFKCFDNTNNHILEIKNISDLSKIKNYDYKSGYPPKLEFNI